jgi:TetR/AcrR family tetracycline transcriptional repressor
VSSARLEKGARRSASLGGTRGRTLTRADVIAAGAQLLDREGISGVSMRGLARALRTGPATLYWHVRGKRELLGAILEETLRGVRAPERGTWDERLLALLRDARLALRARPVLIEIIWRSGWELGPETLRVADELIGLIAESGAPEAEVPDLYFALTSFLFGFVVAETTSPGTGPYRARKGAPALPRLARYQPAADAAGMDRRFEIGAARLVASLRERPRMPRKRSRTRRRS